MKKKLLVVIMAMCLLAAFVIGGTLAWLTASTQTITNTFTFGSIELELSEAESTFKMVPGSPVAKTATVTVTEGSEAAYVYVKVEESANLGDFITYTVDDNIWTPLVDENDDGKADNGIYYCVIDASNEDEAVSKTILTDNQVLVLNSVTQEMVDAIETNPSTAPTLSFTAYAIQQTAGGDAAAAWTAYNNQNP